MGDRQAGWRREVGRLTAEGNRHAELGENAEALSCLVEALDLVPEPRSEHEVTEEIFHGLRRVLQSRGDLGDGLELLMATRPGFGSVLATMAGTGEWAEWGASPTASSPAPPASAGPAPSPGRSPRA